jgi:enoyl-CoA hydratase/carnithine racemase
MPPSPANWRRCGTGSACPGSRLTNPPAATRFSTWLAPAGSQPKPVAIRPDWPFNIIYSSGTTGTPKGIVQPHGMRWVHAQRARDHGYGPDAVTLVSTPLYSNTTLVSFFPAVVLGGTAVLMPKFEAARYLELAQGHRATHSMLVPVQYARLMAHREFDRHDLSAFRMKFCTSAPFAAALKADILRRWPGGLIEYYGMTEGGGTVVLKAHEHPHKLATVGQPAEGHDIRLIDEAGREVAPGEIGEIVGHSPAMMRGYHRQPDKTREAEWYAPDGKRFIRTGDVGRFDADGFLTLMDRKKDMIISGGFNVYPSDLEAVLAQHPAVAEAAVVGVASQRWGETPVAFVVARVMRSGIQSRRWRYGDCDDDRTPRLGQCPPGQDPAPRRRRNRRRPAAQRHRQDPQARAARQFPVSARFLKGSSMEFSTLDVTLDGNVATIALNRPDKANAMSEPMWYEIEQAMQWLDETPEARVGVLVGRGKYFTSGIDLALLMGVPAKIEDEDEARKREKLRRLILRLQDTLTSIERCRKPVLAAIHGACIGGGIDLVTACDMRYCSAEAWFSVREIDVGMTADVGTLQRLPGLIGEGMARELAYTGRRVDGAEAKEMRLVNRCYESAEALHAGVMETARSIAAKSPLAIRGCKEMITYARDHSVADGLNYIATWNSAMLMSKDLFEAGAAAMQKREPVFKD